MFPSRSIQWSLTLLLLIIITNPTGSSAFQDAAPAPSQLTAQEDLQRLMGLLNITSLRRGADARNPQAPNAVNYDEAKATRIPICPIRWS